MSTTLVALDEAGLIPARTVPAVTSSSAMVLALTLAKFRQRDADVNWFNLSDSTGDGIDNTGGTADEWPALFMDLIAGDFPAITTRQKMLNSGNAVYDSAVVRHDAGVGAKTMTLWQGGRAATSFEFPLTTFNGHWKPLALAAGVSPDLIIINYGHNDAGSARRDRYIMLIESVRMFWPETPILVCAQNPRLDANAAVQAVRAHIVRELSATKGYGLFDIFTVINEHALGVAALLNPDLVHLTPAAHVIIADAAYEQLWAPLTAGTAIPLGRPMGTPSLLVPVPSLLSASDFGPTWDGVQANFPAAWTVGGSSTLTKDVTNHETNGYGVKLAGVDAGASAGVLSQSINCRHLQQRYVTFAVRTFIPTANNGQIGAALISIDDGTTVTPSKSFIGSVNPQGRYFWNIVTARVGATATTLTVYIRSDQTGSGIAAQPTFDRVWLGRGDMPHDIL